MTERTRTKRERRTAAYKRSSLPDGCDESVNLARQRRQGHHGRWMEWEDPAIEVGEGGFLPVEPRSIQPACRRLRREVRSGRVGAVLVADISCLGRSAAEVTRFVDECRQHGVVLVVNGKILDPGSVG